MAKDKRMNRYKGLIPPKKLRETPVMVVGCGSIGRQVALQLTAMGVEELHLVDHDKVDETNLGTQGWGVLDVGEQKVKALARSCAWLNDRVMALVYPNRFAADTVVQPVTFCCVDKMDARRFIAERVREATATVMAVPPSLFVDTRMAAEVAKILTFTNGAPEGWEAYEKTLHTNGEAFRGDCTAKSTLYCANIAAGLAVAQYSRWLRGIKPIPEFIYDLFGNLVIYPKVETPGGLPGRAEVPAPPHVVQPMGRPPGLLTGVGPEIEVARG